MTENADVPEGFPLAVVANDPAYETTLFHNAELLLDGEPVNLDLAFAYNIPEGWVDCAIPDEKGRVQVNEARDDILQERRRGIVSIRLKQPEG